MNWTNFDRLVQHLTAMRSSAPDHFQYMLDHQDGVDRGCLACHCAFLSSQVSRSYDSIREFLSITVTEARYLYVPGGTLRGDDYAPSMTGGEAFSFRAKKGIDRALEKLDLVASRYTRPTISLSPETIEQVDRAFVQKCMAVAAQPVEVE